VKSSVRSPLWRSWGPPIFWALFLVVLSGDFGASPHSYHIFDWVLSTFTNLSHETIRFLHPWFRKSLHVIFYGILSVLWFRALLLSFPERRWVNLILALLLTLGVALLDEGHQSFFKSRTGRLGDVGLDMIGAILFTLPTVRFWKRKERISPEAEESSFS
jgi:VanZ family protein